MLAIDIITSILNFFYYDVKYSTKMHSWDHSYHNTVTLVTMSRYSHIYKWFQCDTNEDSKLRTEKTLGMKRDDNGSYPREESPRFFPILATSAAICGTTWQRAEIETLICYIWYLTHCYKNFIEIKYEIRKMINNYKNYRKYIIDKLLKDNSLFSSRIT